MRAHTLIRIENISNHHLLRLRTPGEEEEKGEAKEVAVVVMGEEGGREALRMCQA
jgi:hypothetical protein